MLLEAGLRRGNVCISSLVFLKSGEAVKSYFKRVMRLLNHIITPHYQAELRELCLSIDFLPDGCRFFSSDFSSLCHLLPDGA